MHVSGINDNTRDRKEKIKAVCYLKTFKLFETVGRCLSGMEAVLINTANSRKLLQSQVCVCVGYCSVVKSTYRLSTGPKLCSQHLNQVPHKHL